MPLGWLKIPSLSSEPSLGVWSHANRADDGRRCYGEVRQMVEENLGNGSTAGNGTSEVDIDQAIYHFSESLEELEESFTLFCDFCPQMLSDVENGLDSTENKGLTRAIHSLKGALSNFFPRTLVSQLQEIELRSQTESPSALRASWDNARVQLDAFVKDMQDSIHQLKRARNAG